MVEEGGGRDLVGAGMVRKVAAALELPPRRGVHGG